MIHGGRIKQNTGSAIITAVVVSMVVMVFCLSMLLSAYSLFVTSHAEDTDLPERELIQSVKLETEDLLTAKACEMINNGEWKASENDNKFFSLNGVEKTGYDIKISMHYKSEEDTTLYLTYLMYQDSEIKIKVTDEINLDLSGAVYEE